MFEKTIRIVLGATPIIIMIGLIPWVRNDYALTAAYAGIIAISFMLKHEPGDMLVFALGFFIMIISEYIFISTGVETFNRNSLFGVMPLWLPFLWAYGFVAIKRGLKILGDQ